MANYSDKMILTSAELVERYGNEKQKNHFAKYKKFKSRDIKVAVMTTANEEYEVIEELGKGKGFRLAGKRNEKLDRKQLQNYSNSGNREQLPYKEDIRTAVIQYLNKHKNDNRATITLKRLAYELGCFSEIMYEASRKVGTTERQDYFEKSCETDSRIKEMGWDVFWECVKEVGRLTKQVETVLDELKQNKIIYYIDIHQAIIKTDNEQELYDTLTLDEVFKIKRTQMQLRQKHNVTYQDIMFRLKSPAVKAYKRDEKEYLQTLGYVRIFEAKTIGLVAYDKEIQSYFEKTPLTDAFRFKHIDFAIKLAEAREDAFHNKPVVIKNNNQLHKLLGGKKKKDVYKETATASEKFIGNDGINELLNNEIIQLKMSNCYAEAIDNGLKVLQVEEEATA